MTMISYYDTAMYVKPILSFDKYKTSDYYIVTGVFLINDEEYLRLRGDKKLHPAVLFMFNDLMFPN